MQTQGTLSQLRKAAVDLIAQQDTLVLDTVQNARVELEAVKNEEWFITEVMKEVLWIDDSYEHLLHEVY